MSGPGIILALALVLGQIPTPQQGSSPGPVLWETTYTPPSTSLQTTNASGTTTVQNNPEEEDSWLTLLLGDVFPCLHGDGIKLERPQPAQFVQYPYASHYSGYLWTEGTAKASMPIPNQLDWLSIRGSIEDGNNFSNLNWIGVRVAVDSESRVGGTTNWNWYQKKFDCGCTADAVIGDINLTYRLFQGAQYQVHVGAGCRILAEDDFARTGFNALASADFFPIKPLVASILVDGGTLGSVGVIHTRATLGASWRGLEIFAGYDFLRIGMTDLDGPVGGLKVWF